MTPAFAIDMILMDMQGGVNIYTFLKNKKPSNVDFVKKHKLFYLAVGASPAWGLSACWGSTQVWLNEESEAARLQLG